MAFRHLALTAAVLVAAAACAGSGFTYHSNQDAELYFKLPDDWTVFETTDFGLDPQLGHWVRGFAGIDGAGVDQVLELGGDEPHGFVEIIELRGSERDATSLATLRGAHFPLNQVLGEEVDPIEFVRENPEGPVQLLDYDEVVLDNGAHGIHLRYALTGVDDPPIVDLTALVDAGTKRRYVLHIGCAAACFEQHADLIDEVIESWTLEKT